MLVKCIIQKEVELPFYGKRMDKNKGVTLYKVATDFFTMISYDGEHPQIEMTTDVTLTETIIAKCLMSENGYSITTEKEFVSALESAFKYLRP